MEIAALPWYWHVQNENEMSSFDRRYEKIRSEDTQCLEQQIV
jgi:hypothetical protein